MDERGVTIQKGPLQPYFFVVLSVTNAADEIQPCGFSNKDRSTFQGSETVFFVLFIFVHR